ncbi:protein kinase family protein [Streptomyces lydicus]|uniref:protein kinase n=1 Tax=Streptomyces lydicus TaxID=47763 RepID=UPI000525FFBF|nr:protein kinase [Streptomyces lydicus]UEG92132.1 protein kinase [Streptomyces lydicus]
MDEYAGRVLAERYRLPVRPLGDDDFPETRAFDTYSGQEVLVRQVPLPEVVEAEVVGDGAARFAEGHPVGGRAAGKADRDPRDPTVRRALDAATTVAQLPDHPRLEQVFDVFVQDGSLWVVGELLTARPLSALLAERPLSPHRAAEIGSDLLAALRVLHADGRLHHNITARTVLVCDDGRAVLTGLAVGAAQEALCGYDAPAEAAVSLTKAPSEGRAGAGTATAPGYGRPTGALAAERARQARLTVVGPVTERWAPEQAGPVHENWQLAPPVGPATDLWAVGALLFRCVQGHPPFPEESAAELAQLVCSEPPAVAEECGALRPVVESLLRQDPADRPDFEELRGWLRSLVRTAPEPETGSRAVTMPALERGGDPRRLPILRRRGELVHRGRHKKSRPPRRSRAAQPAPAAQAPAAAPVPPAPRTPEAGRWTAPAEETFPLPSSREQGGRPAPPARLPRPPKQPKPLRQPRAARPARQPAGRAPTPDRELYEQQMLGQVGIDLAPGPARPSRGGPRNLGQLLLTAILLLLVCAVVYAVAFMPKAGQDSKAGRRGAEHTATSGAAPGGSPTPTGGRDGAGAGGAAGTADPQSAAPPEVAKGFALRTDPKGFRIAVRDGWQRRGVTGQGQVRYVGGDYELLVVPGRDRTAAFGADPMAYLQNKEPELAPYRSASWASASGLRRIDVGRTAMAEGTFSWRDSSGREVYVRNLAMIQNGRYHLVLVIGPDSGRREVDRLYEQASSSYRTG